MPRKANFKGPPGQAAAWRRAGLAAGPAGSASGSDGGRARHAEREGEGGGGGDGAAERDALVGGRREGVDLLRARRRRRRRRRRREPGDL
jgi:hypothetical protein